MLLLKSDLTKKSFYSIFLNFFISFIDFFLILVITKFLGAKEFGKYIFIVSVIRFFGLPTIVGYPYFILRKSSYIKSRVKKETNLLLYRNIYVILTFLIFLIFLIFICKLINSNFLNGNFNLILIGSITIIPILSINNSISSIVRSFGWEIRGQIIENLMPKVLLILLIFFINLIYKFETHYSALFLLIISSLISLFIAVNQSKDIISWSKLKISNLKIFLFEDIKESSFFIFIQIFILLNNLLPIIILGLFKSPELVGNYKIAIYLSSITGLCLHAINKIVQPRFAKSFALNNLKKVESIALTSNKYTIFYALLISILSFVFYERIMLMFFGTEFLISKSTFFIILLAPLISSIFGSVGAILIMSRYEKITFYWSGISLIIGLILNFVLIPKIGINGAAISTLIATFIRVFALWRKSFKLLNVNPSYIFNGIFKLIN